MPAPYPAEFKRRAIELATQPDAKVAEIARDLGIAESGLRRWIAQTAVDETPTLCLTQQRCDDPLNSFKYTSWAFGQRLRHAGLLARWAPSATPSTTPWPKASSPPCRPSSSTHTCAGQLHSCTGTCSLEPNNLRRGLLTAGDGSRAGHWPGSHPGACTHAEVRLRRAGRKSAQRHKRLSGSPPAGLAAAIL